MKRSELQTKFFKNKTKESMVKYKKQRNFCSRLNRREKKKYYSNLDIKNVTDNRLFWKTIKPLLSDKGGNRSKITLIDKEKVVSEDQEVSNIFNNYFKETIDTAEAENHSSKKEEELDISSYCQLEKYNDHASIISIKKVTPTVEFDFNDISIEDINRELENFDEKKACVSNGIPVKILKKTADVCSYRLLEIWNQEIAGQGNFPKNLKLAEISPIFKKDDLTLAKNYRPISVLPCLSKVF